MKKYIGSLYTDASDRFQHGVIGGGISRCIKAETHDVGVVEMEVVKVGNIYGFNGGNYAGNVYEKGGIAPTLQTMQGGNKQPMIIENDKMIVAMRGRNPENPSDRTVGVPTEQRLEPNSQGICNTLTSVQKDNLVMETVKIKQATKKGYIELQVGGVADLSYPNSKTRRGRVQDEGRIAPTNMAGGQNIYRVESRYRIRKLTPLECWRLMDFSDEDFHKAESVNSNSQLYKQAGNSIVKNVLVAIMGQMIPGKEEVYREK